MELLTAREAGMNSHKTVQVLIYFYLFVRVFLLCLEFEANNRKYRNNQIDGEGMQLSNKVYTEMDTEFELE